MGLCSSRPKSQLKHVGAQASSHDINVLIFEREKSVERAIKSYNHVEKIPEINVKNLEAIGFDVMQQTLKDIHDDSK